MDINVSYIIKDECTKCIKTDNCDYKSRNEFIKMCLPFYDIKKSGINILNFTKTNYIYFASKEAPTYFINNNLQLELYTGEDITYVPKNLINEFKGKLNNNIIVNGIEIPLYYLFVNNNNQIFNLFILNFIISFNKNLGVLKSLFQYDKNNKFIKMSFSFNIFNIGLLCNKFFDICELFLNNYHKEQLLNKLNEIFKDYNIQNLYTLIDKYKLSIMNMSNEKYDILPLEFKSNVDSILLENSSNSFVTNLFQDNKLDESKISVIKELFIKIMNSDDAEYLELLLDIIKIYKKMDMKKLKKLITKEKESIEIKKSNINETLSNIINTEFNISQISKDELFNILTDNILIINEVLNDINKLIPNFSKLFLMAILSYRLKETYINNTWCFDKFFIYDYINNSKSIISNLSSDIIHKLDEIYIPLKPIIYEYSNVEYKNKSYGNCMENTILQFLKVLFWNPSKEIYDTEYMNKILEENVNKSIQNIFENINREKNNDFDNMWVEFITELPIKTKNDTIGNYIFIKNNYEMDASLINLIKALRYLVKIDYDDNDNIFLNNIIKKINSNYNIDLVINDTEQKISVNCYRIFKIILSNKRHAYFENAKTETKSLNILNYIYPRITMTKYLQLYSHITYGDFNAYICYNNIDNNNELYEKYIQSLDHYYVQKLYKNLLSDNILDKLDYIIWFNIFSNVKILDLFDFYVWEYLINKFKKDNNIWIKLIDMNQFSKWTKIKNRYKQSIWLCAIVELSVNNEFWLKLIDKYDFINWKIINGRENEWTFAIESLCKNYEFWIKLIDKYDFVDWKLKNEKGYVIWNDAFINFKKNDEFWIKLIDKYNFVDWTTKDKYDYIVWYYAIDKLSTNNEFWIKLIDKYNFVDWTIKDNKEKTMWHYAIYKLSTNNEFWIKLIDKYDFIDWNIKDNKEKTMWHYAIYKLSTNNEFWIKLIDKYDFIDWNIKDNEEKTMWHYAIDKLSTNNEFWIKLIDKYDFVDWKIKDKHDRLLWHYAIDKLSTNNEFWIKLIDKYDFVDWNIKDDHGYIVWHYVIDKLSFNNEFWIKLIDKYDFADWKNNNEKTMWNYVIDKLTIKKFWVKLIDKYNLIDWKNDKIVWYNAINKLHKNNEFWIKLIDKYDFDDWNIEFNDKTMWSYALSKLNIISFWKKVILKIDTFNPIYKEIIKKIEDSNHRKYIKYKLKYFKLTQSLF